MTVGHPFRATLIRDICGEPNCLAARSSHASEGAPLTEGPPFYELERHHLRGVIASWQHSVLVAQGHLNTAEDMLAKLDYKAEIAEGGDPAGYDLTQEDPDLLDGWRDTCEDWCGLAVDHDGGCRQ